MPEGHRLDDNVYVRAGNFQSACMHVITCLFSSIGYVQTLVNLKKTLNNFFSHLNDRGLAIVEPWKTLDSKQFLFPQKGNRQS